jgi:hypothetical protein
MPSCSRRIDDEILARPVIDTDLLLLRSAHPVQREYFDDLRIQSQGSISSIYLKNDTYNKYKPYNTESFKILALLSYVFHTVFIRHMSDIKS